MKAAAAGIAVRQDLGREGDAQRRLKKTLPDFVFRDASDHPCRVQSMPMYLRPVREAAAHVDPESANASSIVSPGSEKLRIRDSKAGIGFCVE